MAGRIRVFMLQQETEINEVINCEKLPKYPIKKKKKESRRINDHEVCKLKRRNAAQLRQLTATTTTTTTTTNSVTLN